MKSKDLQKRVASRRVRMLKRMLKKLKTVYDENRSDQLENFRGSLIFLQKVSDEYQNRFRTQTL